MINQLKDSFKKFENQLNGSGKSSWHQLRKEALDTFTQKGFPKAKDEEYRYTPIGRKIEKALDFTNINPIASDHSHGDKQLFHDADAIHIFINNNALLNEKLNELDTDEFNILSLKDASENYADDMFKCLSG